LGRGGVLKVN